MSKLTLAELNAEYARMYNEDITCIILSIQMPTGEIERIVNPNVEEKIRYINKTYDENLVHKFCKDIYIIEAIFAVDNGEFEKNLTFGEALEYVKDGKKISRTGWNGKGLYIELEQGKDYKFSELNSFLVIKNIKNSFNTWVPSISDLLAEDWEVVE